MSRIAEQKESNKGKYISVHKSLQVLQDFRDDAPRLDDGLTDDSISF